MRTARKYPNQPRGVGNGFLMVILELHFKDE
jgi:hypothetical protein